MTWLVGITILGFIVKVITDRLRDEEIKVQKVVLQSRADIQTFMSRFADAMDDHE